MKEENVNKVSSLLSNKDVFSCSYAGKCIRRILLIVCAVMLFSINSQAQTLKTLSTYFSGKGTGTLVDPYQISTANDLEYLAVVCWTNSSTTSGKYFKVMNDIDCSGIDFLPIGGVLSPNDEGTNGSYSFRGTFDGDNKLIYNITIAFPDNGTTAQYSTNTVASDGSTYTYSYYKGTTSSSTQKVLSASGLFGALYGATVKNLNIHTVSITGQAVRGTAGNRAGLAGFIAKGTTITNCYLDNIIIEGSTTDRPCSGGFVAWSYSSGTANTITNCYVKNVSLQGGLAGCFGGDMSNATIQNCYVSGTSTIDNATTDSKNISGCFAEKGGTFINCYTTATITSTSTVNKIAPFTTSATAINNCYYKEGSGATANTSNGISKTSTEMQSAGFVDLLNTTTIIIGEKEFAQDNTPNVNGGYPIFSSSSPTLTSPYTIANGKELIIPSTTAATDIPSIITIKDGGSLINNGAASLLTGKTINVERQLKVGEWNLFGLAQNTTTSVTGVLNNNAGTTTNTAHNMAAVKYDYNNNTWNTTTYLGANAGTGYTNLNIGEGYFVYPLNEDINGNTITDDYTIVSQTVTPYTSDVNISTLTNSGSETILLKQVYQQ
jgi:hypothetical protein